MGARRIRREQRRADMAESRSSPYSSRRKSLRYPEVPDKNEGKCEIPTPLIPARSLSPYRVRADKDMKQP